ncbi:MAG: hypothetical protein GXP61_10310 [Epsilonproteobacteria bacterium]|nr:hypothetical protein [Campylobacterota bacterium]
MQQINNMKHTEVSLHSLVERELFESFALKQDDNKNKFPLGKAKASVARNLTWALPELKGTVKQVLQKSLLRASVARNLTWALPELKGTVK